MSAPTLRIRIALLLAAFALTGCSKKSKGVTTPTEPPPTVSGEWQQVLAPTATSSMGTNCRSVARVGNTFVTATTSGIYRSTNGGLTWTLAPASPTGITTLHTLSASSIIGATSAGSIMISQDSGATWGVHSQSVTQSSHLVTCFASYGTTLLAGTNGGGVHRYVGSGVWQAATTQPSDLFINSLLIPNGFNVVAGTSVGGVYVATLDVALWSAWTVSSGLPTNGRAVYALASSGTTLVAATSAGGYYSTNNGLTWSAGLMPGTSPVITPPAALYKLLSSSGGLLATDAFGLTYRSLDAGRTWARTNGRLRVANPATGFATDGLVIVAVQNGGAYRSLDSGENWIEAGNAADHSIEQVASNSNTLVLGTARGALHRSADEGSTWTATPVDWATLDLLQVSTQQTFIASRGGQGLWQSNDNGATVQRNAPTSSYYPIHSLSRLGSQLLLGVDNSVLLSEDSGSTWTLVSQLPSRTYNSLVSSQTTILAGTNQGILRSADLGATWAAPTAPPTEPSIRTLTFANGGALGTTGVFIAGTDKGVFRSTDSGLTWQPASQQPANLGILCFAVSGQRIFAGTRNGGIYWSSNGGSTWTSASNNQWTTDTKALHIRNSVLYAATGASGLWRMIL